MEVIHPFFVIAEVTAYKMRATQLPMSPSPARYHVPVAHPPASTIPMPKINEPIMVPTTGNV